MLERLPMVVKPNRKSGFTLIEVILVVVISLILLGVSLPNFVQAHKGAKLRSAARTVDRMTRYARSQAIMREETMAVVINHETMHIYLGALVSSTSTTSTNSADGELDQDVLDRLGYTDGADDLAGDAGSVDKEVQRQLPEHLTITEFNKEETDDEDESEDLYMVRFFSNGRSEWFELELEDNRGVGVKLECDPISGKVSSEFTQ